MLQVTLWSMWHNLIVGNYSCVSFLHIDLQPAYDAVDVIIV